MNPVKLYKVMAVIAVFAVAFAAVQARPVTLRAEEMFQMEESEAPPQGVRQKAEEIRKAEEAKQAAEQAASGSTTPQQSGGQTTTDNRQTGGGKTGNGKVNYHGVFDVLSPMAPLFTIKSGNIKTSFLNTASNTGSAAAYLSRKNSSGGYYFETNERDAGALKKLSAKTQYNRQLRNSLSVNSMDEVSASLFDTGLKYNRTVSRTGSGGTQNVSDARKFSAEYKKENGLALSFNIDQNISRTIGGAPSKTNNKKQTWNLTTPLKFRKGAKLTLTHANTGNRNITADSATKVIQSDAKLDVPVSKKFELNLAYQFLGNRNISPAAASENRKNTRSVGMSYKFAEDSKLTYLYNFSSNRNFSAVSTNFDTVNRDAQYERALSKDAKLKLGYTNTYDQASGRTQVRTGNFTYDHKDFKLLPGATNIDTRKQYTRAAGGANTNYTLSVGTPLSYLKGKVTANIQNVLSVQNDLLNSQRVRSMNQTFSTEYKVTSRLSVSSSLNRIKSRTATPAATSARATARVRTDKFAYDLGKKASFVKSLESTKYSYTVTRNAGLTDIPASSKSLNRIRNHALDFSFKGGGWNGGYGFGRSLSYSYGAAAQRSLQHRLGFTLENLWGCQVAANYTGAFQSSGTQIGEILKITKKVSSKTSYYLNWESLKNKSRTAAATRNRYFEIGADLNF